MAISKEQLLKLASVRQQTFKVPSLENAEILMRELTIAEATKINEMSTEKKPIKDIILYACKCSCVEPEFFTDEELEQLGALGNQAIMEIYSEIPLVGKNEEDRAKYQKVLEKNIQSLQEKEKPTKEEEEKKRKRSGSSSSD